MKWHYFPRHAWQAKLLGYKNIITEDITLDNPVFTSNVFVKKGVIVTFIDSIQFKGTKENCVTVAARGATFVQKFISFEDVLEFNKDKTY